MKNFLKTVAGIVIFFAIAVGALTFMRHFNRQPSVILTSTECNPPCWYGIIPGQSTSSEVYATLDQLDSVDKNSIRDAYDPRGKHTEIFWFFQRPIEDNAGSIYLDNDQAIATNILTINSLKLADLFEKIGQPETYWAEIRQGENREFLEVYLLYPTKGCVATVIVDIEGSANQVEIHETAPVFRVTYFAPEMYQELLETQILIDKPVNARTGSLQAWSGFGTIVFERK
jgi:hypothetical protein